MRAVKLIILHPLGIIGRKSVIFNENAQFSTFFFAEQILIFIHVSTPEGGNSQGRRVQECASGILTKKRDGNPHGLPSLAIRIA